MPVQKPVRQRSFRVYPRYTGIILRQAYLIGSAPCNSDSDAGIEATAYLCTQRAQRQTAYQQNMKIHPRHKK
eukprot:358392-Chlamydomonas_euryale.AAC.8